MPFFARRRLQAMLNEIENIVSEEKQRDLIRRIESKQVNQALAGEAEIAMLWGISRIGNIEPEPYWWGTSAPELLTDSLLESRAAVVEVKGVSDGAMGEDTMRLAADKLAQAANRIGSKAGQHLHFTFMEEGGYGPDGYFRRRKIRKDFSVTESLKARLTAWIEAGESREESIRLQDDSIDVVVAWKTQPIRGTNFFCAMPPEAYSLKKNPIANALRDARKQLRNPAFNGARIVILFDAGCTLLRNLQQRDASGRRFSGEQIIKHFLHRTSVDDKEKIEVAVLSAHRKSRQYWGRPLNWKLTVYDPIGRCIDDHPLDKVVRLLPPPLLEGYQARSLHRQGRFQLTAQQYGTGSSYHWNRERVTVKVSTRALLEFLAGRIDEAAFRMATGLTHDRNFLRGQLDKQRIIANATFERGGLDQDDDYIVFSFAGDPAVEPLKPSASNKAPD